MWNNKKKKNEDNGKQNTGNPIGEQEFTSILNKMNEQELNEVLCQIEPELIQKARKELEKHAIGEP